ncbi:hypothetical protein ACJX0J_022104, partial [Zea mays]
DIVQQMLSFARITSCLQTPRKYQFLVVSLITKSPGTHATLKFIQACNKKGLMYSSFLQQKNHIKKDETSFLQQQKPHFLLSKLTFARITLCLQTPRKLQFLVLSLRAKSPWTHVTFLNRILPKEISIKEISINIASILYEKKNIYKKRICYEKAPYLALWSASGGTSLKKNKEGMLDIEADM